MEALNMTGGPIAHYQITEKIGEGGMGVVYKARDSHLDRFVALKVLAHAQLADPERKRRFIREARAASALNHPNIVTIHDVSEQDGIDFIVMEFVSGRSLHALSHGSGLPLREALDYAIQIADGLAAAHAAGIVHRDIKPANIMITAEGRVKLLDFGLAKLLEADPLLETDPTRSMAGVPPTQESHIVGTLCYMSPEQVEGRKLDSRSDIFSFGAVFYEMLTGRRAFQGDSSISILASVLKDDPIPPRTMIADLPAEVEQIVRGCLAKEAPSRIQRMEDVKARLEQVRDGRLPRLRRHSVSSRLYWAGALVLAAGLGIAAWPHLRMNGGPQDDVYRVTPLTSDPGTQSAPTLSPDGNQVAFIWNGEKRDNFDIYVRAISTGSQLQLTADPAYDGGPVWSPDGNYIAFFRNDSSTKCAILLISPLGGHERRLTDRAPGLGLGMDWSRDSRWLVIPDRAAERESFGLFAVSVASGEKRRLSTGTALGDFAPAFSPDGRTLVFTRALSESRYELCLLKLDTSLNPQGEPRPLTDQSLKVNMSHWTSDGRAIIFSAARPGFNSYGLWSLQLSGSSRPRPLAFAQGNIRSFAVARTGTRIVFPTEARDSNVWRLPLAPNGDAGPAEELIASTFSDQNPQFSPDGSKILFETQRTGRGELWTAASDGSNQQPLISISDTAVGTGKWSPDGRMIAFDGATQQHTEIFEISADGGSPRQLTNGPSGCDSLVPSWSRDGKWIYYALRCGGASQIRRILSAGGPSTQVTKAGGWYAQESSDGKTLYYEKSDAASTEVWSVPADGGPETPLISGVGTRAWTPVNNGIYFFDAAFNGVAGQTGNLRFFSFPTQKTRLVGRASKPVISGITVSPDGRSMLFSQIDNNGSNLMLAEKAR